MNPSGQKHRRLIVATLGLFVLPILLHGCAQLGRGWPESWSSADWSSTGQLPPATAEAPAMVRIYAARTGRWRGIVAVHSWLVLKDEGGRYERYDKVGWGSPIRRDHRAPDARWFGHEPALVFAADGAEAAALIARLRPAIASYPYGRPGDYRAWPGPNSNTFVAHVMAEAQVPAALPPTAIGKDYPVAGRWLGPTPSGTGLRASLGGVLAVSIGWIEGLEVSLLGAVLGLDLRRPAVKLPGFGRLGMPAASDG